MSKIPLSISVSSHQNISFSFIIILDIFETMLSFLDLPGEIRNQIYSQLLILPPLSVPRLPNDFLHPKIIATCHKIYLEARMILYGSNTFMAHHNLLSGLPKLRVYMGSISSPSIICLIRRYHIRVRLDCDANFKTNLATKSFTGVEELTIEVFQAQFGSCDYNVLKLFEGVRGVERTRIYGSVQAFPEYVEWLKWTMEAPIDAELEGFDKEKIARVLADRVRSYDI